MSFAENGLKRMMQNIAQVCLPHPLLYELWHLKSKRSPRPTLDSASNRRVLRPQTGVVLEVYWSEVAGVGRGPSASLFVLEEEVLRLDCFGGMDGHLHYNPEQVRLIARGNIPRLYFLPAQIPEQIDRAAFELKHNSRAAMALNMLKRVRRFQLQQDAFDKAAADMSAHMLALCQLYSSSIVAANEYKRQDDFGRKVHLDSV